MRIMIVDDDEVILRGVLSIIKKSNVIECDITTAYNGVDALEKMSGASTELLITDISMPGINGLELIREVKMRKYCSHFAILTGYKDFEFARQAIKYNVETYLLKPIDKEELLEIIQRVYMEIKGEFKNHTKRDLPDLGVFREITGMENCTEKMKKILDYIKCNYMFNISLGQVSCIYNLHPNYICNLFKNELDMTFLHYLNGVRIRESAEKLLYEDRNIKDIALSSGFMNERHFYKVFRQRVGLTPGQFREKYMH